MKHGHPSREWSKGPQHKQSPAMKHDAKRGGDHLREHMREETRKVDRSYESGKDNRR